MRLVRPVAAFALLATATACPSETNGPRPGPSVTASAPVPPREEIPVVTTSGENPAAYLDGMRLAVEEVEEAGGPRLALVRETSITDALAGDPAAVVVVEDPQEVTSARAAVEEAGAPVVLLGADLYSTRELFRQVFQVGPPLLWQARVLAHYLVVDREHERVRAVAGGPSIEAQRAALAGAFGEEGIREREAIPLQRVLGDPATLSGAESVIFLGGGEYAAELARAIATLEDPPQLALSSEGLSQESGLAAGTVASYHYAWSGWAEPIERVRSFRSDFAARYDREPSAAEQEGYEAIRVLAEAITRARESGRPLMLELETFDDETYSALPVLLGPDDHVFVDESQLGLFAADAPAANEPWVDEPPYWRPLMRTFTFDGEKTNVLDLDKTVFFPSWQAPRPSPKYHRSRFGIVTRYGRDPLH